MKIVHKEAVFLNGDIEVFGLYHPDTELIEVNIGCIRSWVAQLGHTGEEHEMIRTLVRLTEYHELAHWAQHMLGLEFDEIQADLMATWHFIAKHKYMPFQWSVIPNPALGRKNLLEYKPKEVKSHD